LDDKPTQEVKPSDEGNSDAEVFRLMRLLPPEIGARVFDLHAGLRHREYEATCALQRVTVENVAKSGASAINIGLVINGGAAAAVLALVGHLAASPTAVSFTALTQPLCYFSTGVFINALARGADYFAGNALLHKREGQRRFFYGLTILLVTLCVLAFPLGCWRTAAALFSISHR
jgi:hypothetical protein